MSEMKVFSTRHVTSIRLYTVSFLAAAQVAAWSWYHLVLGRIHWNTHGGESITRRPNYAYT